MTSRTAALVPIERITQSILVLRGQHRTYLPYAFTEQGVAMLSSALRSRRAIPWRPLRIPPPVARSKSPA